MNKKEVMKHIVSFDKSKIFYRIKKNNKTKTFTVFLHGLSCNNSMFRREEEHLIEKNYNTINIDVRGHGFSQNKIKKKIFLKDFCKDIELILKKEKVNKINLVGYSMGGFIALKFYSLYPKYVKKMILIDSSYAVNPKTIRPYFFFLVFPACCLIFLKANLFDHVPQNDLDFSENVIKDIFVVNMGAVSTVFRHVWETSKAIIRENLKPVLKKIKIPVLIIENQKDDVFSILSYYTLEKHIKKSELKLERGNHNFIIIDPDTISKDILEFLKKK